MAQVYGTAPRAPVHCRKFDRDTCLLQNISFQQYSLHLWVWWRTHDRRSDLAYSKNLEGNASWNLSRFMTHSLLKWNAAVGNTWWLIQGGMATGLQGTDNPIGLPIVCLICLLFSSRRISDQQKNGSCRLGFGLSQQWVLGAVFECLQQM